MRHTIPDSSLTVSYFQTRLGMICACMIRMHPRLIHTADSAEPEHCSETLPPVKACQKTIRGLQGVEVHRHDRLRLRPQYSPSKYSSRLLGHSRWCSCNCTEVAIPLAALRRPASPARGNNSNAAAVDSTLRPNVLVPSQRGARRWKTTRSAAMSVSRVWSRPPHWSR